MSYSDDFIARLNVDGNTIADSQFNTTAQFINTHFAESPYYKVVKCNGVDLEIQLQDINVVTRSASVALVENILKFILLRPNSTVNIGDMIEFDNMFWMVTDSISDNPLFPKVKIEKCNYLLQWQTGETKTLVGHDSLNRPVYSTQPSYTPIQCLLRTTVSTIGLNQAINLPSGQAMITVKYDDTAKMIKENNEFDLYNQQYKVVGLDYTNIVQGTGCLIFLAERVVNT